MIKVLDPPIWNKIGVGSNHFQSHQIALHMQISSLGLNDWPQWLEWNNCHLMARTYQ
jgi:hypothetical protein